MITVYREHIMLKKFFVAVGVLWMLAAQAQDTTSLTSIKLEPESRHSNICETVTALLSNSAYNKVEVNDDLSKKVFKEFLTDVDYTRSFFLQADIDDFKTEETRLDDYLKSGKVSFPYKVYNQFLQRANSRIQYTYELLKDSMDFSVNDSFEVRRQDAPWCKTNEELDRLWRNKIKYECLGMLATGRRV